MIEYDYRKYTIARTRKEFLDAQAREGWEYVEGLPPAMSHLSGTGSYDVLFKRELPDKDAMLEGVIIAVDGHTVGFVPARFGTSYPTVVSVVAVRGGKIVADPAMFNVEPEVT